MVIIQLEVIRQRFPMRDGDIVLTEAEKDELAGTLVELFKLEAIFGLTETEATQQVAVALVLEELDIGPILQVASYLIANFCIRS